MKHRRAADSPPDKHTGRGRACLLGFTLVELLISIAIMGTLASMAMIGYRKLIEETRNNVVKQELRNIQNYIDIYLQEHGELPESLDDLGMGAFVDPWGNPYRYQAIDMIPPGKQRKDHFLVPLNTDYDLWSMGPDGKSRPPLTAQQSRDDIIRATDGEYIGPASEF
jgi:general secretion pathway protein G